MQVSERGGFNVPISMIDHFGGVSSQSLALVLTSDKQTRTTKRQNAKKKTK